MVVVASSPSSEGLTVLLPSHFVVESPSPLLSSQGESPPLEEAGCWPFRSVETDPLGGQEGPCVIAEVVQLASHFAVSNEEAGLLALNFFSSLLRCSFSSARFASTSVGCSGCCLFAIDCRLWMLLFMANIVD